MANEIIIRAATPADADACVPLITQSGPVFYRRMLGGDDERAVSALRRIFSSPGALLCHENAFVICENQRVVGLVIAYEREQEKTEGLRFFRTVVGSLPLLRAIGAVVFMLTMAIYETPRRRGRLYAAVVTVNGERRGRGVGALLMAEFMRRTRAGGFSAAELDVEIDNDRAKHFYERLGYRVEKTHPTGLYRSVLKFSGHHRMVKEVTPER